MRIIPFTGVLLLSTWASLVSAETGSRPNIVFIYADDLGYGDLACHGHPHILTPNLDRMAKEGTDFQSFTVVNPVCSPSRTGIVTGQFPSRWGVHQHFASHQDNVDRGMPDWLDPEAPMLPRQLKQAGYRTAHYGKWHLSGGALEGAPLPTEYGYDDAAVWTGPGRHPFEGTQYAKMERAKGAHDPTAASFISVAATDLAVKFIRENSAKSFFINLWLHETHHLVSATEEDKAPYPDTAEPQRTYYAAVTRADRQVGRVLEVLDELKLAENTLVIFSSDNGPENSQSDPEDKLYFSVGETGGLRGRKRSLLMGGVNVPFLVRWPGIVPAGRVDQETALAGVDVFPTLLAAAKVNPPADYVSDGENVLAAFKGESFTRTKPIFWWWQGKHTGDDWPAFAMREGSLVLVMDETKAQIELYDVVADRAQSRNLATEQPDQVARMKAATEAWFETLPKEIDPRLQEKEVTPAQKRAARMESGEKPKVDRSVAFEMKDLNKDNQLTLEEYLHRFPDPEEGKRRFPNFDKNGDGLLSREEFVKPNGK